MIGNSEFLVTADVAVCVDMSWVVPSPLGKVVACLFKSVVPCLGSVVVRVVSEFGGVLVVVVGVVPSLDVVG